MANKHDNEVTKKLSFHNGSIAVPVPIPWLDQVGIGSTKGTEVSVKKKKNGIFIEKVK